VFLASFVEAMWFFVNPLQEGDYVERVEPSSAGGRKMAQLFVKKLKTLQMQRNSSAGTINA
jgi:hypothetical protein